MRANIDEHGYTFTKRFVMNSQVASDVDASITFKLAHQRVIIQDWMEGIFYEQVASRSKFTTFLLFEFFVSFFETSVKYYFHTPQELRYLSISSPVENGPTIFLPAR